MAYLTNTGNSEGIATAETEIGALRNVREFLLRISERPGDSLAVSGTCVPRDSAIVLVHLIVNLLRIHGKILSNGNWRNRNCLIVNVARQLPMQCITLCSHSRGAGIYRRETYYSPHSWFADYYSSKGACRSVCHRILSPSVAPWLFQGSATRLKEGTFR